jgi:hypothetical protein
MTPITAVLASKTPSGRVAAAKPGVTETPQPDPATLDGVDWIEWILAH